MKVSKRESYLYLGLFALSCLTYFTISQVVTSPTEVTMPTWVPFLPILAIPYLLQVAGSYVLALAIRDDARRRAAFLAYFASFAVTCTIWYFYPTVMHRPPQADGWWNIPFRIMAGLDAPVNVVPAGHILMPVIIIWAFAHDHPKWLWWLVPAELLGMVAIVTTWQHRPVDVLIGIALALGFGWVFGVGRQPAEAIVTRRAFTSATEASGAE